MTVFAAPIATMTHAQLRVLLEAQPWPFWAIDRNTLEPLIAYYPVTTTRLLRVLQSHYTYSDLYIFNPCSAEADVQAIDWQDIPQVDAATCRPYIVAQAAGQPFLGLAGSLDTARQGEVVVLLPAADANPLRAPG